MVSLIVTWFVITLQGSSHWEWKLIHNIRLCFLTEQARYWGMGYADHSLVLCDDILSLTLSSVWISCTRPTHSPGSTVASFYLHCNQNCVSGHVWGSSAVFWHSIPGYFLLHPSSGESLGGQRVAAVYLNGYYCCKDNCEFFRIGSGWYYDTCIY